MFRRKDEGIKIVTQKEMEKSFKRIDKAFPAIEEDDLLRSVPVSYTHLDVYKRQG